jgi:pimeloyl-ACP methyl ester carboxylesterase
MYLTRTAFAINSRRGFLAAATALAALLPMAAAWAAPFASDRITVRVEGSGADVVLIPGLNSSPRTWTTTVAALPGYRYHLVQVSGFAGQPAGANKAGLVAAPVAEEIARYIKEAGIKPAVVGHSMGGIMGMMLASRHPDALTRLMVVDIFPYMGMLFAGPGATPAQVAQVADRVEAGMRAATPEERSKRAADTIAIYANNEAMRPIGIEDSLKSDPDVTARAYHELIVTNLIPELSRIAVPVTVLYVQPKSVPISSAQFDGAYQNAYAPVKQLTLKRIEDSAHFIMWDQPQRFQAELKAFLDAK